MENRILNFSDFSSLYESYGFLNEEESAKETPEFTPTDTKVTSDELLDLLQVSQEGKDLEEAANPSPFVAMKVGEKSDRVKFLQQELGLPTDLQTGYYGDKTKNAVLTFQKNNKLKGQDGIVGVETLTAILKSKGDQDPEKTITTKFKVKNASQAVKAGLDPRLLELYDITIVYNGKQQYIVMIPRKGAGEKAKALKAEAPSIAAAFDWLLKGVENTGKALIYTMSGVYIAGTELGKAMISGIASAAKFVVKTAAGAAAYVMGAAVQGIVNVGKWIAQKGKQLYATIKTATNTLWNGFCEGFATVAKSSVQAFKAFLTGVKVVGYTLTGLALTAFKKISSTLDPVIKGIINAAKDGAQAIASFSTWVASNVKDGAKAVADGVKAGWEATKVATQNAWNGAKAATKAAGEAIYNAAANAYTATTTFLGDMYTAGMKFWESEILYYNGEEAVFEFQIEGNVDFDIIYGYDYDEDDDLDFYY